MYADGLTDSMARAINETNRRRALQQAYNEANGIQPQSVRATVHQMLEISRAPEETAPVELPPEETPTDAPPPEEEPPEETAEQPTLETPPEDEPAPTEPVGE